MSIVARYTARYKGNGCNEIAYEGINGMGETTDIEGVIRFAASGKNATKVTVRQTIAPDTPVPRLLQGLVRSFVEREASAALKEFLENVKKELEEPLFPSRRSAG